eukprot:UN19032
MHNGSCVSPDALRTFIGKTQWNIISTSSVDRTVEYMIYIPSEKTPLSQCVTIPSIAFQFPGGER